MLYGISGAWYGLACGIGLILLAFIAPKLRKLSLFTAPEYLGNRYESGFVRNYATVTSMIALIGILAAQIIATQHLLAIFGIPPAIASIIATLIFISYTYLGGMWAVTLTDFFQLTITALGVIALAIFASPTIASVSSTPEVLSPLAVVGIVLPTVMYTLIGQDFYQRLFSARDEKVAKNSSLMGGIMLCAMSFLPAMIGLSLLNYGNEFYGALGSFFNAIPTAFGSLFVIMVLGGIMSTADSLLSALSSHVVKDVIKSTTKGLFYSRASVVGMGVFALLLSFAMPTIIDALVFSYTIYTAAIFFPLVLGMFWKGGNATGAISSMLIATAVVIVGFFFNPLDIPLEIFGSMVSLIIYVLVSYVTG